MEDSTVPQESELKLVPTPEGQAKFTAEKGKDYVRQQITRLFDFANFSTDGDRQEQIEDIYLDTAERDILAMHGSCRIRKNGATTVLTLKREKSRERGLFQRDEYEFDLHDTPLDNVLASNGFHPSFDQMREALPEIANRPLEIAVRIHNDRTEISVNHDAEKYAIALDAFYVVDEAGKAISPHQFELEIEAKSPSARQRLPKIRQQLSEIVPDLELSQLSKYELASKLSPRRESRVDQFLKPEGRAMRIVLLAVAVVGVVGGTLACIKTYRDLSNKPAQDESAEKESVSRR